MKRFSLVIALMSLTLGCTEEDAVAHLSNVLQVINAL